MNIINWMPSVLVMLLSFASVTVQAEAIDSGTANINVTTTTVTQPVTKPVVTKTTTVTTTAKVTSATNANDVYTEDKQYIFISPNHPTFVIKLKSNPTTGFSWYLRDYNTNILEPVRHSRVLPAKKLIGAPGYEFWSFRIKPAGFKVPQQTTLRLIYARPWESSDSATQLLYTVTTQGR